MCGVSLAVVGVVLGVIDRANGTAVGRPCVIVIGRVLDGVIAIGLAIASVVVIVVVLFNVFVGAGASGKN